MYQSYSGDNVDVGYGRASRSGDECLLRGFVVRHGLSSSWTGSSPLGGGGSSRRVRISAHQCPITEDYSLNLSQLHRLGRCLVASERRRIGLSLLLTASSLYLDTMPSRPGAGSRPSTPAEYSTSTISTHSAGPSLRSHLFNIIPKHTLFKVKLHIRQISNVPLLGGDFAVKWRFRNVQSPGGNHSGFLSKMKANSSTTTMTLKGKTKDYFPDGEDTPTTQSGYPWTGNGVASRSTPDPSGSPDYPSPFGTKSSSSSFSVIHPSGSSSLSPAVPGMHSDNRGITTWTELSDHTATWDHHVALIVRMDVDHETLDLHESELKLTVLQVCTLTPTVTMQQFKTFAENRPR